MAGVQFRHRQGENAFPRTGDKTYALMELPAGTSPAARGAPGGTIMAWPTVYLLEFAIWSVLVLALVILGAFVDAPLGPQADPAVPPNPALMPWYLASIQELTLHIHPVFAGIMIPTLAFVGLAAIPYLDRDPRGAGRWFGSRRAVASAIVSAILAAVAWIVLEWLDLGRDLAFRLDQALNLAKLSGGETPRSWPDGFGILGFYDLTEWSAFLWAGVVPFLILAVLLAVIGGVAKLVFRCNRRELLISLFTAVAVSVVVLTFVGSLMRGTDAQLYAPWDRPNVIEIQK